MAGSPRFKVFRGKEYVASCKYPEDAAAIVATSPTGATIRDGHTTVVWNEGREAQPAGESFDFVASTIYARLNN